MTSRPSRLSGPPLTERRRASQLQQEGIRPRAQITETWAGLFKDEQMRRAALNLMEDATASRQAEQEETDQRERTTQALCDSESRLQLALEAASMGTWDVDLATQRVMWNDQHYRLFGLTPDQKPKYVADWLQFIHPEDRSSMSEAMRHTVEETGAYQAEFRIIRSDGTVRWLAGYGKVMERRDGRPTRMAGVTHDVTERREADEKLAEALRQTQIARAEAEAASRAKDEFLAVLSHELRTPLTPLLLATEMLLDEPGLPEEVQECVQMMSRNVRLEARLVDDLLDVIHVARGSMKLQRAPADMHQSIQHAVSICRPDFDAKLLHLDLALNASHCQVHIDCARIQQVIWNLLRNACKFTPPNGKVRLETSDAPDGILVQVIDDGIGMEPDELAKIFGSFVQANKGITQQFGGLGLGLSISKAIVEAHSGRIWVESDGRDKGATFSVLLPLHSEH